jgi:hypothetical protein
MASRVSLKTNSIRRLPRLCSYCSWVINAFTLGAQSSNPKVKTKVPGAK